MPVSASSNAQSSRTDTLEVGGDTIPSAESVPVNISEGPPEEPAEEGVFPPAILLVAQQLLQNADAVQKLMQTYGEQAARGRKHELIKTLSVAGMFFLFMAIIVGSAAFLVHTGGMDGNAFSFLIAVVVGSMITFVGSAVFGQVK